MQDRCRDCSEGGPESKAHPSALRFGATRGPADVVALPSVLRFDATKWRDEPGAECMIVPVVPVRKEDGASRPEGVYESSDSLTILTFDFRVPNSRRMKKFDQIWPSLTKLNHIVFYFLNNNCELPFPPTVSAFAALWRDKGVQSQFRREKIRFGRRKLNRN